MTTEFITKQEVAYFTELSESDITDTDVWIGNVKVENFISARGFTRGKYDGNYPQLKLAALYFVCESLLNRGKIDTKFGDILEEKIGQITIKRSRQPMFFFSRGLTYEQFTMRDLIPHETFRQQAYTELNHFVMEHAPDKKLKISSLSSTR